MYFLHTISFMKKFQGQTILRNTAYENSLKENQAKGEPFNFV